MKTPSRKPILATAAALLLSSASFVEASPKAEDRPVPSVPTDVLEKGGDAVLDWMLDNGYLTPDYLKQFTKEKAHTVTEGAEAPDADPLLTELKADFDSLPDSVFRVGVKPTWEAIAKKLTPDVLVKANKLEYPSIYGVNQEGQLLIGDGEVPAFTLKQDYLQARSAAQAAGLSLMTESEYRSFNNGTMEEETNTWLESGDAPSLALYGYWEGGVNGEIGVKVLFEDIQGYSNVYLGARRVFRLQL